MRMQYRSANQKPDLLPKNLRITMRNLLIGLADKSSALESVIPVIPQVSDPDVMRAGDGPEGSFASQNDFVDIVSRDPKPGRCRRMLTYLTVRSVDPYPDGHSICPNPSPPLL